MASFREKIEAVLKAKDAGRFNAAMNAAANAIENVAKTEKHAEAQSVLLDKILAELEEQTIENAVAMEVLSHEVNALASDMRELAASSALANTVMKKSGDNAVFLGKSWAFWKDRLSLTRSEIYTTALTIGTYLSPALLAMGSSFAYAALGGGGVFAGGMSSFVVGLLAIKSVAGPVIDGIKKIKTAQEQYNVAVDQFGAASIQASRANARLYAIIQNNGGPDAASALARIQELTSAWETLTAPGRASMLGMLNDSLTTGGTLAPIAANQTNQIAASLRAGWKDFLKILEGPDIKAGINAIGDIFRSSIGSGIRSAGNLLVIFSRVVRASAPWVKMLATSWERATKAWKDKATMGRVEDFLNEAVNHTRAWWGLAKQLMRTVSLLLRGSRKEGQSLVVDLTHIVDRFNDWLQMMEDTGKVSRFFDTYISSLKDIVWALQNPMDALDRYMPQLVGIIDVYLPKIMDSIANTLGEHGPRAAEIFLTAFLNAGAWTKFLTVSFLLWRFGVFGKLGALVAATFLKPFLERFTAGFVAAIAVESAAGGRIAAAMSTAGTRVGTFFGRAMVAGVIVGLAALGPAIVDKITGKEHGGWGGLLGGEWDSLKNTFGRLFGGDPAIGGTPGVSGSGINWTDLFKSFFGGGKAAGGMIFPGQTRLVGEFGPEPVSVTNRGAMVTPANRVQAMPNPIVDIPDLTSAIRLITNVSVQVEKREIARAVADSRAYDSARRGQEE